jgi:Haem-NO-binding
MKGTIVKCMENLVVEKFGAVKWKESLKKAGIVEERTYTTFCDVEETEFPRIMKGVAEATSQTVEQVTEAFGEYWSTVYAPNVYQAYYSGVKSARELLLNLDHIHETMTKSIKSAHPPRFLYEWKEEKLLIMHYESRRGLVGLMPGLIRGVGKYFGEKLTVRMVGNAIHVRFP